MLSPPPEKPERGGSAWWKREKCGLRNYSSGRRERKCTPPPEPPRFISQQRRPLLACLLACFFPMHMHTMHYIALHYTACIEQIFFVAKSPPPLRPVVVPAVLATPMTEVAWSCPVLVDGGLWRANQEQLVQERGGRKKKRKAEGCWRGGAMCGVLCLRRCGDEME